MICAGQENRGVCQVKTNPVVIEVEAFYIHLDAIKRKAVQSSCVSFIQLQQSSLLRDKNLAV